MGLGDLISNGPTVAQLQQQAGGVGQQVPSRQQLADLAVLQQQAGAQNAAVQNVPVAVGPSGVSPQYLTRAKSNLSPPVVIPSPSMAGPPAPGSSSDPVAPQNVNAPVLTPPTADPGPVGGSAIGLGGPVRVGPSALGIPKEAKDIAKKGADIVFAGGKKYDGEPELDIRGGLRKLATTIPGMQDLAPPPPEAPPAPEVPEVPETVAGYEISPTPADHAVHDGPYEGGGISLPEPKPAAPAKAGVGPAKVEKDEVSDLMHQIPGLTRAEAQARVDQADQQASAYQYGEGVANKDAADIKEKGAKDKAEAQQYLERSEQASKAAADYRIDPNRYMHNASFLQKALMMFAAASGGLASGIKGGPNQGMEQINRYIDQDIAAQKAQYEALRNRGMDINNQYSMFLKATGNEDAAMHAAQASTWRAVGAHTQAQTTLSGVPPLKAAGDTAAKQTEIMAAAHDKSVADNLKAQAAAQAAAARKAEADEEDRRLKAAHLITGTDFQGTAGELSAAADALRKGQPNSTYLAPKSKGGGDAAVNRQLIGQNALNDVQAYLDWKESVGSSPTVDPEKLAVGNALYTKALNSISTSSRGTAQAPLLAQAASRLGARPGHGTSDMTGQDKAAIKATLGGVQRQADTAGGNPYAAYEVK